PLINWQDRRTEETFPGAEHSFVAEARRRLGEAAPLRTGCRLAAGYLGATLFWLREKGLLPSGCRACFLMDHVGSVFTHRSPVTEATCAASGGIFDLARGDWDEESLAALGLSRAWLPSLVPAGTVLGELSGAIAQDTGLPEGLPVVVGIGDNQASFLGSVA